MTRKTFATTKTGKRYVAELSQRGKWEIGRCQSWGFCLRVSTIEDTGQDAQDVLDQYLKEVSQS